MTCARIMCAGCPFRQPGENRTQLLEYIAADPSESWPCHESAEFDDLAPEDCQGRVIFGELVERILAP